MTMLKRTRSLCPRPQLAGPLQARPPQLRSLPLSLPPGDPQRIAPRLRPRRSPSQPLALLKLQQRKLRLLKLRVPRLRKLPLKLHLRRRNRRGLLPSPLPNPRLKLRLRLLQSPKPLPRLLQRQLLNLRPPKRLRPRLQRRRLLLEPQSLSPPPKLRLLQQRRQLPSASDVGSGGKEINPYPALIYFLLSSIPLWECSKSVQLFMLVAFAVFSRPLPFP
ncbi:hypothetical protein M407DRAFT_165189 [Tulasnella calospora MUT 4182]|uniref:Uncharacterized protein n=1 Tax=Tulasnella calospora MUT 4182 TaxID=1051891 RepID=A0A0C3Q4Q5_9AGAM|nr:hypothetical protein M407DRAFT_165189 [Tulasnella calospora MUT 4182]